MPTQTFKIQFMGGVGGGAQIKDVKHGAPLIHTKPLAIVSGATCPPTSNCKWCPELIARIKKAP